MSHVRAELQRLGKYVLEGFHNMVSTPVFDVISEQNVKARKGRSSTVVLQEFTIVLTQRQFTL